MQSITLQGRFGIFYRLYLQPSAVASLRISPVKFNNVAQTCQFMRGLHALPSYWMQLAKHLGIPTSQRSNSYHLEQIIAKRLIADHIRIYELTATPHQSSAKPRQTLKGKANQDVEIATAQQMLNEGRLPNQAFNNASAAFAFLGELNPTTEQLNRLANNLNIQAPPNQYQAEIAQKIAAGEACVVISQRTNNTLIEHQAADTVAPAPKPRTLGPQAPPKAQQTQTAANDDANQTSTLAKAAEEGTPFCEECEQSNEDAKAPAQKQISDQQANNTAANTGNSDIEQEDQNTAMAMAADKAAPFCEDCSAQG